MFDDKREIASSYGLQFFLCLACTNTTVMWKFGKFQGAFDLLKTFKWFSSHLMTVFQIWTTSTARCQKNWTTSTPTSSIGVLFIQRQRPLLPRDPVHPTPTRNCSSNPHRELFIKRQLRSASVSSSSEGITRVQLTARDRSGFSNVASAIARVQLEPNASLGFS